MYNDIYIAPMSGIYPPSYVIMVNGRAYDYLTCRPGHPALTISQENDIIAGYREWLDFEPKRPVTDLTTEQLTWEDDGGMLVAEVEEQPQ